MLPAQRPLPRGDCRGHSLSDKEAVQHQQFAIEADLLFGCQGPTGREHLAVDGEGRADRRCEGRMAFLQLIRHGG